MLRLNFKQGSLAGRSFEFQAFSVRMGRAASNELVLPDDIVSGNHAVLTVKNEGSQVTVVLEDRKSTNGTHVVRGAERFALDQVPGHAMFVAHGDLIEFGSRDRVVRFELEVLPATGKREGKPPTTTAAVETPPVTLPPEPSSSSLGQTVAPPTLTVRDEITHSSGSDRASEEVPFSEGDSDREKAHVFALRRISELSPDAEAAIERDQNRLRALYTAQKRIGIASDLNEVLVAISDAALDLVPQATHVTIIVKSNDDDPAGNKAPHAGYVPVMTRVRGLDQPSGPIPITRSVFRKVLSERAVVLAADAPNEMGQSESLLGARIHSTLGVPLWRGEEILGVLQLDNRESPTLFAQDDLDIMAVLAHNASLAMANARLMQKLRVAEERLKKENAFLKGREQERRTGSRGAMPVIIGNSSAMAKLLAQLDKVVDTKVTVLVEGETGAGKELIAASVHYRSRRKDKLFVGQNCAAMPENLLESELFGHKKGSFTGAIDEKKGLFEIADGGTLFLDEVTEMPLSLQSKLLRALQEGEIRPVGSTVEKKVDVRIVAATNRNLEKEVAEGRFREDLYYRLKVFPLRVPPLRERREDIPVLANYFVQRFAGELGKPVAGFTQQAMELLQAYDFPGNVRELQNEVQRLMIQVDPGAFVTPELLSPRVRQVEGLLDKSKPTKGTLKEMVDQVERWILIESLREHGNNKTAAAKVLGITREGLHKKLRQYGL